MINKLSSTGQTGETAFNMLLSSIFSLNAISLLSVYKNNEKNLRIGTKFLSGMLSIDNLNHYWESIRYFVGVIKVESLLNKEKRLSEKLGRKLQDILILWRACENQKDFNAKILKEIDAAYKETIS